MKQPVVLLLMTVNWFIAALNEWSHFRRKARASPVPGLSRWIMKIQIRYPGGRMKPCTGWSWQGLWMEWVKWLEHIAKKLTKFSIRKWRKKMRIKHRVRRIAKNVRRKLRERIWEIKEVEGEEKYEIQKNQMSRCNDYSHCIFSRL